MYFTPSMDLLESTRLWVRVTLAAACPSAAAASERAIALPSEMKEAVICSFITAEASTVITVDTSTMAMPISSSSLGSRPMKRVFIE